MQNKRSNADINLKQVPSALIKDQYVCIPLAFACFNRPQDVIQLFVISKYGRFLFITLFLYSVWWPYKNH